MLFVNYTYVVPYLPESPSVGRPFPGSPLLPPPQIGLHGDTPPPALPPEHQSEHIRNKDISNVTSLHRSFVGDTCTIVRNSSSSSICSYVDKLNHATDLLKLLYKSAPLS